MAKPRDERLGATFRSPAGHALGVRVQRWSPDAGRAIVRALDLIRSGVDDEEAVARLRTFRGGREALREAAERTTHLVGNGYPATRVNRLLRAAAGEELATPTAEAAAVEAAQRAIAEQPASVSFEMLAEHIPALRELELRARTEPRWFVRELSPFERLLGGPGARAQRLRVLIGIQKAVQRLLGPSAELSDPVLSSIATAQAVTRYLVQVAGVDPLGPGRA